MYKKNINNGMNISLAVGMNLYTACSVLLTLARHLGTFHKTILHFLYSLNTIFSQVMDIICAWNQGGSILPHSAHFIIIKSFFLRKVANIHHQKGSGMKNKKIIIAVVAVIVIIGIAAVAVKSLTGAKGGQQGGPRGMGGPGGMGGGQQEVSYTVVKAEHPHYGDVSVSSSLTGTVEASDVVHIYAKASGDVTEVNVIAGDTVETGQVLMTINTEQVESAQNQMDSAKVNLDSASSTLSRMQILYNGGDITAQEYEQYQDQYKSAELSYESAKINYDKQVSYSTIKAPIAGTVESVGVEVYDNVSMNNELAVISGEGEKRITAYVSERMMQNLREGDEIEVYKNGNKYAGRLTEISSIVDSATGLFRIKAELEDTGDIATGSSVKIIMVTDRSENVMLVPVDAIYYSGGNAYVYVVRDGVAKMQSVEVGLYDSEVAEIKSGLTDDDNVVSTWSNNLYDGASVRLYDDVYGAEAGAAESAADKMAAPDAAANVAPDAKVPAETVGNADATMPAAVASEALPTAQETEILTEPETETLPASEEAHEAASETETAAE